MHLFLLMVLLAGAVQPARAALPGGGPQSLYADHLVERARGLALAEDPAWHALLHYRPNWLLPGVTAQADDPDFYLAPGGQTDPEAELEATLRAFLAPAIEETAGTQHPQCRFAARFHWLKERLGFDPGKVPVRSCPRFDAWRGELRAREVTLIFPSAYINNPSSMFGHTLLRIDGIDQDDRTRLLAHAVNYAVDPGTDGQVTFIFKSLTGFYPGEFSVAPYYTKVRDYSDLENRDIWEYRLDLDPTEIEQLVRHAWELSDTHFDYFFFDENCAYHLLSLLEVARSGLELSRRFRGWVIPVDTVRAVEEAGMVRDVVYRPAGNTRLRARLDALDGTERRAVLALAAGAYGARPEPEHLAPNIRPERRAAVLDAAFLLVRQRAAKGQIDARLAAERSRGLLLTLSRLPEPRLPEPAIPAVRPEQGHRTARVLAGAGHQAGQDYLQIGFRPAYNDLLDPPGGYAEGAQINFLDVGLRQAMQGGSLRLEHVHLIDVLSLAPRNAFFPSTSWRLGTGLQRRPVAGRGRGLVWRNVAGAGLAFGHWERALAYAMVDGTADVSRSLGRGYAAGIGPSVGLHLRPRPAWKVHLWARMQEFRLGARHHEREFALEQSLAVSANQGWRLYLGRRHDRGPGRSAVQLSWHGYF